VQLDPISSVSERRRGTTRRQSKGIGQPRDFIGGGFRAGAIQVDEMVRGM
jgi:hypothetical protein